MIAVALTSASRAYRPPSSPDSTDLPAESEGALTACFGVCWSVIAGVCVLVTLIIVACFVLSEPELLVLVVSV